MKRLLVAGALLAQTLTSHVAGVDPQVGPSEAARQVQDMVKAAWRASKAIQVQRSQEDLVCEWLGPVDAVVVLPRVATTDFGPYSLGSTLVQTTVESTLRRRRVPVVNHQDGVITGIEQLDPLKLATLCVEILGRIHSEGKVASVCVLMKLEQDVALVAAETPTFARADTWQRAVFVMGTPRHIRESCPRELRELAGFFADDWDASRLTQAARSTSPAQESSVEPR